MLEINGVVWPRFIKRAFNPDVPGQNNQAVRAELLQLRDLITAVESGGQGRSEGSTPE